MAQPQVDTRLTPRLQLRSCRPPPASRRDEQSTALAGLLGHGVVSRSMPGWRPTSDALCRASVLW
jgi:hypothetical protein